MLFLGPTATVVFMSHLGVFFGTGRPAPVRTMAFGQIQLARLTDHQSQMIQMNFRLGQPLISTQASALVIKTE
jgi:hypothetical protein